MRVFSVVAVIGMVAWQVVQMATSTDREGAIASAETIVVDRPNPAALYEPEAAPEGESIAGGVDAVDITKEVNNKNGGHESAAANPFAENIVHNTQFEAPAAIFAGDGSGNVFSDGFKPVHVPQVIREIEEVLPDEFAVIDVEDAAVEELWENAAPDGWTPKLMVILNEGASAAFLPEYAADQMASVSRSLPIPDSTSPYGKRVTGVRQVNDSVNTRNDQTGSDQPLRISCDSITTATKTESGEDPVYTFECAGRVRMRFAGTVIDTNDLKYDGQTITFTNAQITTAGSTTETSDGTLELSVNKLTVQKFRLRPPVLRTLGSPFTPWEGSNTIPEGPSPFASPATGNVPMFSNPDDFTPNEAQPIRLN